MALNIEENGIYDKMGFISLFEGMTEDEKLDFIASAKYKIQSYKKGDYIFREGENTEFMGIVLEGKAIVEHSDMWGNNTVLGRANVYDAFGEVYALLPETKLMISVIASENTRVILINIFEIINSESNMSPYKHRMLKNLLNICANKSLGLSKKIIHCGSKTIRGKLMSYFSDCVQKCGEYSFEIPYNRQQLADYLGADRSALCAELSKMQKDGIIKYRKNSFDIKNDWI